MAAAGLALILAACSSGPIEVTPSDTPTAPPAPPSVQLPTLAPTPAPSATARDQCGAADMQGLVGKPRTEIPIPIDPARQRVACTTCPVTMDFSPVRLNFFFDAATGVIKEVRCG
jgi:hypothetical protein